MNWLNECSILLASMARLCTALTAGSAPPVRTAAAGHMAFSFLVLAPVALLQPWESHRRTLEKQWKGIVYVGSFMVGGSGPWLPCRFGCGAAPR